MKYSFPKSKSVSHIGKQIINFDSSETQRMQKQNPSDIYVSIWLK